MRPIWTKGMTALAVGLLIAQTCLTAGIAPAGAADPPGAGKSEVLKTGQEAEPPVIKTVKEAESYGLGVETGKSMRKRKTLADPDIVIRGLKDQLRGDKTRQAPLPPDLATQKEKQDYTLGANLARNLQWQEIEVDWDLMARGMKDAMVGNKLLMKDDDIAYVMEKFRAIALHKRNVNRMAAGQENREKGAAFLAANKAKEGVVTLRTGLQYQILKAGDGPLPTAADTVECKFRSTLINGTEVENTDRTGEAVTIKVSDPRIIAGLRQALQLMPVGSKWRLFIPSRLAYGGVGRGRSVGPDTTLIYELELIAIKS